MKTYDHEWVVYDIGLFDTEEDKDLKIHKTFAEAKADKKARGLATMEPHFPKINYTMRVRVGDIVGINVPISVYLIARVKEVIYTIDNGSLVEVDPIKVIKRENDNYTVDDSEIVDADSTFENDDIRRKNGRITYNSSWIFNIFEHGKIKSRPIAITSGKLKGPHLSIFDAMYTYIGSLPFRTPISYIKEGWFEEFFKAYPGQSTYKFNKKLLKKWLTKNWSKCFEKSKVTKKLNEKMYAEMDDHYWKDIEAAWEMDNA